MSPGLTTDPAPVPLPTDHLVPVIATPDPWRVLDEHSLLDLVRPLLRGAGITRVTDLTGLDDVGLPVVSAVRPNARSLAVSAGKGATLAAATASAVMEALETHAAEVCSPTLRLATPRSLGIDLSGLPRTPLLRAVDTPVLWCAGRTLLGDEAQLVPFEVVHTDWSSGPGHATATFVRDSNGLASGQTADEARLHALLEIVERDAAHVHGVRPPAAQDARRYQPTGSRIEALLATATAQGKRVGFWNLTSDAAHDVGVPVVMAVLLEAEHDPFRPLPAGGGYGAHPDPELAAVRALTEAAQSRLITIAGARDDLGPGAFARCFDAAATDALRQRILAPGPRQSPPRPSPVRSSAELADRVATVTGFDPWVVDLTPPDWPVAVCRVVAPGLEGSPLGSGAVPGPRARAAAAETGNLGDLEEGVA